MASSISKFSNFCQDSGQDNYIMSIINYDMYEAPKKFCFDVTCNDEPIVDNPEV